MDIGDDERELVPLARLELALLDQQVSRELRLVAPDILDEALGVLAPDVDVERVAGAETFGESESSTTAYTSTTQRMTPASHAVEMALPDLPPNAGVSRWPPSNALAATRWTP